MRSLILKTSLFQIKDWNIMNIMLLCKCLEHYFLNLKLLAAVSKADDENLPFVNLIFITAFFDYH